MFHHYFKQHCRHGQMRGCVLGKVKRIIYKPFHSLYVMWKSILERVSLKRMALKIPLYSHYYKKCCGPRFDVTRL